MTPTKVRVGIWGFFGQGNFGNEATLTSLLSRLDPEQFEPRIFSTGPRAPARIQGFPARPVARPADSSSKNVMERNVALSLNRLRALRDSIDAARSVDAIVIAGSGALERYGSGPLGWLYEVWALARSARLTRRPLIFLDIGVQTHPSPLARFFVRSAARAATYRSYRDTVSRDAMVAMGVRGAVRDPVVSDMAFSLGDGCLAHDSEPGSEPLTAVVGVMNYRRRDAYHDETDGVQTRYARSCAELVRILKRRGYSVHLVGGDDEDLVFASDLAKVLDDETPVLDARSPEELMEELTSADVVVSSRYHTLIMALLVGTPVVGLGYSEKHRAMFGQLGLAEQCYDIESFDPEEVAIAAETMASDNTDLRRQISAGVSAARARLDEQWGVVDQVLRNGRRKRR